MNIKAEIAFAKAQSMYAIAYEHHKNDNLVRNLPNQHVRQTYKSKL